MLFTVNPQAVYELIQAGVVVIVVVVVVEVVVVIVIVVVVRRSDLGQKVRGPKNSAHI